MLTAACHNQIIESVSANSGASFTGQSTDPRRLTIVGRQRRVADEFFQSTAASSTGVVVSYYDRQYGNDDINGFNDISITFNNSTRRVTTASSPPETQFALTNGGDTPLRLMRCFPVGGLARLDGAAFTPPWAE